MAKFYLLEHTLHGHMVGIWDAHDAATAARLMRAEAGLRDDEEAAAMLDCEIAELNDDLAITEIGACDAFDLIQSGKTTAGLDTYEMICAEVRAIARRNALTPIAITFDDTWTDNEQ